MKTTLSFLILLVLSSTTCGYGSIAISEPPTIDEMAEKADLAFIGRVQHITYMEKNTIYRFEVHEYIKESRDNVTFLIQISDGLKGMETSPSPTFEHGENYLVFLMDDVRFTILYGHYGRLLMDTVDSESLNVIRETYGSTPVYSFAGGVSMYNYTIIWENGTVSHGGPWIKSESSETSDNQPVGETSYDGIEFQQILIVAFGVVLLSIFIVWLLSPNQK
jgi:hypothetical protein